MEYEVAELLVKDPLWGAGVVDWELIGEPGVNTMYRVVERSRTGRLIQRTDHNRVLLNEDDQRYHRGRRG